VWSPDGTQIAFTRDWKTTSFSSDLFVMDADGSNQVNLTNGAGTYNFMGDWSPDGLWMLFVSNRSGSLALCKMHLDGSDPRMVFSDAGQESGAAWSLDGSHIVLTRESATISLDVWVINADGSAPTSQSPENKWLHSSTGLPRVGDEATMGSHRGA
jgi:Tol biopolymer transport system component